MLSKSISSLLILTILNIIIENVAIGIKISDLELTFQLQSTPRVLVEWI